MSGEMWDRRKPSAPKLTQLASLWLQINAVPPEGLWYSRGYDVALRDHGLRWRAILDEYAAWAETRFPSAVPQARAALALLAARQPVFAELAAQSPVLCFCRSDPRFSNVIARPGGRIGLVDWEDSGLRDPAVDLADVLTHGNQEDILTADEWQHFLRPYLAERGRLDPGLERRLSLYLALFPLFWLAILCRAGLRRAAEGKSFGWTANSLPINARLRRFLARAQSWPSGDFTLSLSSLDGAMFFPEAGL
jgi:aminoglycoside phosphotransferase (APT) family kinase protein